MSTEKSEKRTVDEYISSFPEDVRVILEELREVIKEMVPEVEETIRYDMPTFMLNGKYLVYFAAWKKHISLYPFTTGMESDLTEAAGYYISGKGTIQFPLDKPLPMDLIRKIVQIRIKENAG